MFNLTSEGQTLKFIIERARTSSVPVIELVKRAAVSGARVGVFAASFNPITRAHIELMQGSVRRFGLHETLALAGVSNADKSVYECPLEERLEMLILALEEDDATSIGVSSHPYFVDMVEALDHAYGPDRDFYFIVGFDTFERVLDRSDRYTRVYHHRFRDRREALTFLAARSRLVVAGRAGATLRDVTTLLETEPEIRDRVLYLDVPDRIAERSATEVRQRIHLGESISHLVPAAVERRIRARGLYQ